MRVLIGPLVPHPLSLSLQRYTAAQLYYTAFVIESNITNFVVVGPHDMLKSNVPQSMAYDVLGLAM